MEQPFGTDVDDLKLDAICNTISTNLAEIARRVDDDICDAPIHDLSDQAAEV